MTKRTKQKIDAMHKKQLKRLRGTVCKGVCAIHGEPCTVVTKYKDKKIQRTVEALRAIQGAPLHTIDSENHYCELCAMAMRDNRPMDAYAKAEDGTVYLKNAGTSRFQDEDGIAGLDNSLVSEEE
jgi:hypothetical protein